MTTSDFFAESYADARRKFLKASKGAGARLNECALPTHHGPDGETLFVDVAQLGPTNPQNMLVLISGTHGVEGFGGSGCQVGYLQDRLYEALAPDSGVILIHALKSLWLRVATPG